MEEEDDKALAAVFGKRKGGDVALEDGAESDAGSGGSGRSRLTLRVDDEIAEGLEIIAVAGGASKNQFCEGVLRRAVRAKVVALKGSLDAAEWDVLMKLVRRRQSGGARGRGGGGSL